MILKDKIKSKFYINGNYKGYGVIYRKGLLAYIKLETKETYKVKTTDYITSGCYNNYPINSLNLEAEFNKCNSCTMKQKCKSNFLIKNRNESTDIMLYRLQTQ